MLNKKALGDAIAAAIKMKIESGAVKTQREIADHFGVKPPSIIDWKKKGSIEKNKIPELFRYFSDVAGPSHWGLTEDQWPKGLKSTAQSTNKPGKPTLQAAQEPPRYNTSNEGIARDDDELRLLKGWRAADQRDKHHIMLTIHDILKTDHKAA